MSIMAGNMARDKKGRKVGRRIRLREEGGMKEGSEHEGGKCASVVSVTSFEVLVRLLVRVSCDRPASTQHDWLTATKTGKPRTREKRLRMHPTNKGKATRSTLG